MSHTQPAEPQRHSGSGLQLRLWVAARTPRCSFHLANLSRNPSETRRQSLLWAGNQHPPHLWLQPSFGWGSLSAGSTGPTSPSGTLEGHRGGCAHWGGTHVPGPVALTALGRQDGGSQRNKPHTHPRQALPGLTSRPGAQEPGTAASLRAEEGSATKLTMSAPFLGNFQVKGRLQWRRSPTSSSVPPQPRTASAAQVGWVSVMTSGGPQAQGGFILEAALDPLPPPRALPLSPTPHAPAARGPLLPPPCRKGTCTGTSDRPRPWTQPLLASETAPSSSPTSRANS